MLGLGLYPGDIAIIEKMCLQYIEGFQALVGVIARHDAQVHTVAICGGFLKGAIPKAFQMANCCQK
jgi:hypothetical protein